VYFEMRIASREEMYSLPSITIELVTYVFPF
jgi:hypothetical protein